MVACRPIMNVCKKNYVKINMLRYHQRTGKQRVSINNVSNNKHKICKVITMVNNGRLTPDSFDARKMAWLAVGSTHIALFTGICLIWSYTSSYSNTCSQQQNALNNLEIRAVILSHLVVCGLIDYTQWCMVSHPPKTKKFELLA